MRARTARLLPLCAALAAAALPTAAIATNGYFLIGFGAKSRGMGGVGVAYAQDALAAASNPAGMIDIDMDTMRIDVGGEFFNPPRAVLQDSQSLPANVKSGSNLFLIPNMGGAYKFNRNIVVGMAAVGAGLGTRYDQSCANRPSPSDTGNFFNFNCAALANPIASDTVGVSLMQMQMLPSLAYKINKKHAVGGSLAIGIQTFRAYGLQAFQQPTAANGNAGLGFAQSAGNLTNEGNDWSYGAGFRLGYLGKFFNNKLVFGANYSSRVYMTQFDKYRNLFAEQGDFDIPENYTLGFAYHPNKKLTLAFDWQHINFSDIASVGNPGPKALGGANDFWPNGCTAISATENSCMLGKDNGLGFGWDDMDVYKLGVNYDVNKQWSVRAGANYGDSPIPNKGANSQILFNMLAPATVEWHATIGASYRPSQNTEWSFNYMHAFEHTLKGPTAFGPTGDPVVGENASISMRQNSLGVSFSYRM